MESLGYVLMYFLLGRYICLLPYVPSIYNLISFDIFTSFPLISLCNMLWQGLRGGTIKQNYNKISEKRKLTRVEVIVTYMSDMFTVVLKNMFTAYAQIFSH